MTWMMDELYGTQLRFDGIAGGWLDHFDVGAPRRVAAEPRQNYHMVDGGEGSYRAGSAVVCI